MPNQMKIKRLLKIILWTIGILLAVLVLIASFIHFSGIPKYESKAPELTIKPDSAMVAEGARMAMMTCAVCHKSKDGKLGGAHMPDTEAFGEVYAPNITQHVKYGINDYTDGELAYLLRTGIRKDGQYTPPWMTKYPHLSTEDLNSLIAFLRSDHPMVQPSNENPPESKPSFLAKFLCRVAFKPLPYPQTTINSPSPVDEVSYGKYLATAKYDCFSCHSASFEKVDVMQPENSEGYMGGGNPLKDIKGQPVFSSNLTMDKTTGIGTWTKEEFIKSVKTNVTPDGKSLRYPMTPYALLTDEEVGAIWTYLQTIPIISNPRG